MGKQPDELLRDGLLELGFAFSEDQVNCFMTYLTELKKWNKTYNLTGIKKDEDIIMKHFLDSLLYLRVIPGGELKVADVGSGAGFPGIPVKIIRPEMEMYLVEPSGKKAEFLRHIIRTLRIDKIEVIERRVEDLAKGEESFLPVDIAVTRALFSIKDFIKKTSRIVRQGGILILSKGPKVKEEIKRLKDTRCEVLTMKLPLSDIERYIVVVSN
jgi:16S rRNA (guanine527-N7)-methyltransferase